ncbi:MAG TPA: hypothetical protein VFM75_05090 [Modicisalibacter sp.]|nr:hypothetical protein [Modicisalibacter sp.]
MIVNCVAYQEGRKLRMNFEHMPELEWGLGYPLALGLMGVCCGSLYLRFRKAGWL